MEVLLFLLHHCIEGYAGEFQTPTQMEAAVYFKIPQSTIGIWWNTRMDIQQMKGGGYQLMNAARNGGPIEPEPDSDLFLLFALTELLYFIQPWYV